MSRQNGHDELKHREVMNYGFDTVVNMEARFNKCFSGRPEFIVSLFCVLPLLF